MSKSDRYEYDTWLDHRRIGAASIAEGAVMLVFGRHCSPSWTLNSAMKLARRRVTRHAAATPEGTDG